ncbi:PTS fructose transporter subunit IIB [Vaginisenegalia massiliensis]|uniref:PTS fructose transporter subunit IIB n=1 Tax=Vaginisenegalia massiliensis TaxID=2058294 RepID=UPI002407246E|nr:fructose PTS transporter subunit IIB [Vaginisenegalia massiliensis]
MTKKILAITACPTGIAHTYMAAENLEKAARELGVDIKVETHGSIGVENVFTDQEIKEAEGLIIAADTDIDKSRFNGIQIIETGVQKGIHEPKQLITKVLNNEGKVYQGQVTRSEEERKAAGNVMFRALMNGVSFMIPFVVTGGLLLYLLAVTQLRLVSLFLKELSGIQS